MPRPRRPLARVAAAATVDDHVGVSGSGLDRLRRVAVRRASAATAVLTVPRMTIGTRDGRTWVSWVLPDDGAPSPTSPRDRLRPHWSAAVDPAP
jgi:menaquinone-specific isochorismate synthase